MNTSHSTIAAELNSAQSRDVHMMLQYAQDATMELVKEIQKIKDGEFQVLYRQTRSFVDAMQRIPNPAFDREPHRPPVRNIRHIRECYLQSQRMDGSEKVSHFTKLLEMFLNICRDIRALAFQVKDWICEPIEQLTVHQAQREMCRKIQEEMAFWERFIAEDNNFIDLNKHKTLQELRGLDFGETRHWSPAVNLIPVLIKTAEQLVDLVSKWFQITRKLGTRIYEEKMKDVQTSMTPKEETNLKAKRVSLDDRPPWKPASTTPHNLHPTLPLHQPPAPRPAFRV